MQYHSLQAFFLPASIFILTQSFESKRAIEMLALSLRYVTLFVGSYVIFETVCCFASEGGLSEQNRRDKKTLSAHFYVNHDHIVWHCDLPDLSTTACTA